MEQYDAEKRLAELRMEDMPVIQYLPRSNQLGPDWFKQYKQTCHNFVRNLTDTVEELALLNLSQEEFVNLVMGIKIPDNLSIRFRIPLTLGGEITEENMFMCKTFPHSQNLDRFIIEQHGNKKIWLPSPVKKIYVPAHSITGGDGGNATEDRLSQIAAQLAANRSME